MDLLRNSYFYTKNMLKSTPPAVPKSFVCEINKLNPIFMPELNKIDIESTRRIKIYSSKGDSEP
jgi:hypothetical protein